MKNHIILFSALILMITALAGCASQKQETTENIQQISYIWVSGYAAGLGSDSDGERFANVRMVIEAVL